MPEVPHLSSSVTLDFAQPASPSTKTINVEVPDWVYWHVRKFATESRLSMKEYMTRFCGEAWDYPQELHSTFQAAEQPGTPQLLRTLNVEVPEAVYWHIRKCATESHLSLKGYMTMFCQDAATYTPEPRQTEETQGLVDVSTSTATIQNIKTGRSTSQKSDL